MGYWSKSELTGYLEELEKNDTSDVAHTLFTIGLLDRGSQRQPMPTGNVKVIAHLEKLLEDRRGCVVEWRIPHSFGELRWLAAQVLVCEYAYLGIEKPIILKDVVQPIRDSEIAKIDQHRTLDELIEQGLLPTKTEIIKPEDYAWCCSKEAVEKRIQNEDKNE